jgi:hypothetical protein
VLHLVRIVGLLVVVLYAAPVALQAQTENSFALGASLAVNQPTEFGAGGGTGVNLLWRFGKGHEGWGWNGALNWYSATLQDRIGAKTFELGKLHVRPLLGGYGYSHKFRGATLSGEILAGYAFMSFQVSPEAATLYRAVYGPGSVQGDATNGFVVKPDVSLWFDITPKVGVNIGAGYLIARPTISITTAAGTTRRSDTRGDAFMLRLGAVYSLF